MGVDQVDLIQLHNLVEPDELDIAHGPGGAVEALAKARDEGLVRFIGVTGHGMRIADMHLRSLERFDFDSVLLPYNFTMMQNEAYRASFEQLVVAVRRAQRRRADDQVRRPAPLGGRLHRAPLRVVRAAAGRRSARPRGRLRARPSRPVPQLVQRRDGCSARFSRPRPAIAQLPTDEQLAADVAALDMRPLFDGAELERI